MHVLALRHRIRNTLLPLELGAMDNDSDIANNKVDEEPLFDASNSVESLSVYILSDEELEDESQSVEAGPSTRGKHSPLYHYHVVQFCFSIIP